MDTDSLAIARWQFRLAWGLADDVHLRRLTDDACLMASAPRQLDRPRRRHWPLGSRLDRTGTHRRATTVDRLADMAHSVVVVRCPVGRPRWQRRSREEVYWLGTARAINARLRDLASRWDSATRDLDQDSLARPTAFPWPDERPLIYTIAWVPLELMKNLAEIGEIANMYMSRPTN